MGKTKKPSGLSIVRNDNKFTLSWKIGSANYGSGQKLQYRRKDAKGKWRDWIDVTIGKTTTTKVLEFDKSDYYPAPNKNKYLKALEFRVKGKREPYTTGSGKKQKTHTPDWSDWTSKSMAFEPPKAPSVTATLENQSYTTTFAWEIETSDSDEHLFYKYEYQSVLVKECTETNGAKLNWDENALGFIKSSGTATSGNWTKTEDSAMVAQASYTRWFRIRAIGPAGCSEWVYAKHVYAMPYVARISKASATPKNNKILIDMTWKANSNAAHPIDETIVEYCKGIPTADLEPPASPSWTQADISKDTKGMDKAVFYIDGSMGTDECLWVKVTTRHDNRENYSAVKRVDIEGPLADPSGISVSVNGRNATISATNNSQAAVYSGQDNKVKRLFLAVYYRGVKKNKKGYIVGIIPTGQSSVSVTLPESFLNEDAYSIGVRAIVGTYSGTAVESREMESDKIWTTANVPKAPANVKLDYDGNKLTASWEWTWEDADSVELSWSGDKSAWDSTEEPEKYVIDRQVKSWSIKGLEAGKTYYVRVRLIDSEENLEGPYSDKKSIKLSMPPQKPVLKLSNGIITGNGKVTASWNYQSGDGTEQAYAEIRTKTGETISTKAIAHVESDQHITMYAKDMGWQTGSSYQLILRVKSGSGEFSDYSDPVSVEVAPKPQASITSTSLQHITVTEDGVTRGVDALTVMPFAVTVAGAKEYGTTEVAIERAEDYHEERPDEETINGFLGETVFQTSFTGEGSVNISNDDLYGYLDDGAAYYLVVTVSDSLGQSSTVKKYFEVHWSHQAIMPRGTAVVEGMIAKITPIAPSGTAQGDYCDIYRLSVDKPVLIYPNASFGETYVDPYPAIGEHGGHRIVFRTKNGDYITSSNQFAWLDLGEDDGDILDIDQSVIDFDLDSVFMAYNMELSSSWKKDFRLTKYLGGSVQGDWDAAVERNSTIKAVGITYQDQEMIKAMRRLAEHTGICHIRTVDGSSYAADVQVSESSSHDTAGKIATFDITITRVDPEGYDGLTLEAWEEQDGLE